MLQHCNVVVNLCVLTIEIERMLTSEVRILGDAAFTLDLMTTNMVSVASVAACDARVSRPPYLKKAYCLCCVIWLF